MTSPSASDLFTALGTTWPAARVIKIGPWQLREGLGGGKRVSSAFAISRPAESDIQSAIAESQSFGQPALFMIRDSDSDLDHWLDQKGFGVSDPTALYLAKASDLAQSYPMTTIIPAWPPLAIQREIWAGGGVNNARIAVMNRAEDPKTSLIVRIDDTPSATVFLAKTGAIAMLHALEVQPENRRRGAGEIAVRAAAKWGVDQGADWLALAVTKANVAANALYQKLGMSPVASYHYRRAPFGAS